MRRPIPLLHFFDADKRGSASIIVNGLFARLPLCPTVISKRPFWNIQFTAQCIPNVRDDSGLIYQLAKFLVQRKTGTVQLGKQVSAQISTARFRAFPVTEP
jgi:hypothetical protein